MTSFSTLKRVVKGPCSCRPQRESIHIKPEKVKCKCTRGNGMEMLDKCVCFLFKAKQACTCEEHLPFFGSQLLHHCMARPLLLVCVCNQRQCWRKGQIGEGTYGDKSSALEQR